MIRKIRSTQLAYALLALFSATAITACGDKSLDDYKEQKLQEDLGKLSSAKGSYSGLLKRQSDSSSMGALKITLTPDITARTSAGSASSDNTRADSKAVLRAEIEFRSRDVIKFTIPDSAYSPTSGTFGVSFSPSGDTSASASDQLTIDGNIQGSVFTGTIRSLSSNTTAEFSLTRDGGTTQELAASIPGMQVAEPGTAPGSTVARSFSGSTTLLLPGKARSLPVNLVILDPKEASPAAALSNLFAPTRVVQMSFSYGGDLTFGFSSALWDQTNGTLTASTNLSGQSTSSSSSSSSSSTSNGSLLLITECRWSNETHLSCTHTSGNAGTIARSEFDAGNPQTLKNPFEGTSGPSVAKTYTGTTKFTRKGVNHADLPVNMFLLDPTSSADEDLRRLFQPVGTVQMNLAYGDHLGFAINNTVWDRQSGRISGSDPAMLSIECYPTSNAGEISCRHVSAQDGVVAVSTLREGDAIQLTNPFGNVTPAKTVTQCGTAKGLSKPGVSRIDVVNPSHSAQDEFLELFFPAKADSIQVTLDLFGDGNGSVSFDSATYDPAIGGIEGSSSSQGTISPRVFTVKCIGFDWDAPKAFSCTYKSSGLPNSFTLEYDPKIKTCLKDSEKPVEPSKPDPKPQPKPAPKGPKR